MRNLTVCYNVPDTLCVLKKKKKKVLVAGQSSVASAELDRDYYE